MAYAGLRKEEARHLKTENIEGGKISIIGKGGKAAVLPIFTRLKSYLDKYLTQRGSEPGELFPKVSAMSLNYNEHITKAAIKAVQMLMRHENVTLTLNIYEHLLPSDLEKEVEL